MTDSPFIFLAVAESFLQPMGPIAEAQREHLVNVILLTLVAIAPALVAVPIILWRYRRGNAKAAYRPEWNSNPVLESLMWGVPLVVVALVGVSLWKLTHRLDPYRRISQDPVRVEVIGLDWKWLFLYPDQGVAMVDELVLPVGRAVSLRLTTDTVMQSFRVSALAGQIYAMPGMETELHFMATREGESRGENTQFSGERFWEQKFRVRSVAPAAFQEYLQTARNTAAPLTDQTYSILAEQGTARDARHALKIDEKAALRFRLADPGFFDRVVSRYHTGAAVTAARQPGSPSYQPAQAMLPPPHANRHDD